MAQSCCQATATKRQLPDRASDLRVTSVSRATDNSFVNKPPKNKVVEAKIILLGDSGVGKSSIGQRYCLDVFSEAHDVTIGAAYF